MMVKKYHFNCGMKHMTQTDALNLQQLQYLFRWNKMKLKDFSPLVFLASLGAGGIAVMPFVLMQYTIEHGKGLITRSQLWAKGFTGITAGYYYSLEAIMIAFVLLHFILTVVFTIQLFKWMKTNKNTWKSRYEFKPPANLNCDKGSSVKRLFSQVCFLLLLFAQQMSIHILQQPFYPVSIFLISA